MWLPRGKGEEVKLTSTGVDLSQVWLLNSYIPLKHVEEFSWLCALNEKCRGT